MNYIDEKTKPHRYKVNVLHNGKERWRYCSTIDRARYLQQIAIEKGLSSLIFQKASGKYHVI